LVVSGTALNPVHWIASSQEDLRSFPNAVQRAVGYALFRAQEGKKAPDAKPLKGIIKGAGVLEIVEDHDTDTYRVVYTVRFAEVVYVLHAFQKKSKRGKATPKHEIALIRSRYEHARAHHEAEVRNQ
jgi:phage-related protein